MNIRLANINDLEAIKDIFVVAKEKMKSDGNIHQWEKIDYPFCYTKEDIELNRCYIENGNWLNDNDYLTIHRIASNNKKEHIFHTVIEYLKKKKKDIRIDTHKDNKRMKHLIEKERFKYCGIIYVRDGTARDAYQLEVK